eukprot:gnl/MRDRNA2_/MRDRNA2_215345_c0_seq1.p1 gnl/MRDRNA2_/MRDRNA2_215345_c0~~gnl/MRDRNA2_/MRDRNA2_215345_c0_seq1.p1  ORF type:complete len:536 (-),score=79.36 gnl/MRDRNA2_/MRDRNA2_215345_c0_seq1:99-1508(-)
MSAFTGVPMAEIQIRSDARIKDLKLSISRATGVPYMQLLKGDRVLCSDEVVGQVLDTGHDSSVRIVSLVVMQSPEWQLYEGLDMMGNDVLKLETCRGHGFMTDPDFIETMQYLCAKKGWMAFNVHNNGRLFNAKKPCSTQHARDSMRRAQDWRFYVPSEDLIAPLTKSLNHKVNRVKQHWKAYEGWDMRGGDVLGFTVWCKHGPSKDPDFVESMKYLCQKKGWKAFNLNDSGDFFHAKTGPSAQAVLDVAKPTRDWTLYVLVGDDAAPCLRPVRSGTCLQWTVHDGWDIVCADVLEFESSKGCALFKTPTFLESMQYLCEQKNWKGFSISGDGRWFSAKIASSVADTRSQMIPAANCTLHMPLEDDNEECSCRRGDVYGKQGWKVHKDFYMPGGNVVKLSAPFAHGLFNDDTFIHSMKYLCELEGWVGFNVNDSGWWFNVKTAPSVRSVMDYSKPMGGWTLYIRDASYM